MSSKKSGKLVRDKIPKLMIETARRPKTRVLKGKQLERALSEKLVEEAREYRAEPSLEELADVVEVVKAILEKSGQTWAQLERVRLTKRRERGGFKKGVFLFSK